MSARRKFPHERGPRPDRNENKRVEAVRRLEAAQKRASVAEHRQRLQRTIDGTRAKLSQAARP